MHHLQYNQIQAFGFYLHNQERSSATIQKYLRTLERFYSWLEQEKQVDKETVIRYKEMLQQTHAPGGVNAILAALNGFFRFQGWQECMVRPLRIQRRTFSSAETELSREEYRRLVSTAQRRGDSRLELLLQLMASTGIRVSEIKYVTVEAVSENLVQIQLKGKIRTILLPGKLCHRLRNYAHRMKILSGPIFLSRTGKTLDRRMIWLQMKRLCREAGVSETKVFPHNLRHLFARTFYNAQKDIAKLADVMGHSSIETTRIYLVSSGQEHRRILDRLQLLC